jgi:uncharacterized membrane protein YbaN (DUF454 family)
MENFKNLIGLIIIVSTVWIWYKSANNLSTYMDIKSSFSKQVNDFQNGNCIPANLMYDVEEQQVILVSRTNSFNFLIMLFNFGLALVALISVIRIMRDRKSILSHLGSSSRQHIYRSTIVITVAFVTFLFLFSVLILKELYELRFLTHEFLSEITSTCGGNLTRPDFDKFLIEFKIYMSVIGVQGVLIFSLFVMAGDKVSSS